MFAFSSRYQNRELKSFTFENLGQRHVAEKRYLCRSTANINLHKSHTQHLCVSVTVCEKLRFKNFRFQQKCAEIIHL